MNKNHILSHLYYFLSVYKHRNYAKVSEEFHVSLQAISYQVKMLEQKLGITLVNRTSDQNEFLTLDGEYLGKQCLDFFRHFDSMIDTLQARQINKEYVITAPVAFGAYVLLPLIELINRELPEVEFTMVMNNKILDMDRDNIDIAIRNTPPPENIEYEEFANVSNIAIASKDYLKHAPPLNTPADLSNHTIIQLNIYEKDWIRLNKLYPEFTFPRDGKLVDVINGKNNSSIVKAVQLNKGIGLVPTYVFENILNKDFIEIVLKDYINEDIKELTDQLYICYSTLSIRKDTIKMIVKLLKEAFNKK